MTGPPESDALGPGPQGMGAPCGHSGPPFPHLSNGGLRPIRGFDSRVAGGPSSINLSWGLGPSVSVSLPLPGCLWLSVYLWLSPTLSISVSPAPARSDQPLLWDAAHCCPAPRELPEQDAQSFCLIFFDQTKYHRVVGRPMVPRTPPGSALWLLRPTFQRRERTSVLFELLRTSPWSLCDSRFPIKQVGAQAPPGRGFPFLPTSPGLGVNSQGDGLVCEPPTCCRTSC